MKKAILFSMCFFVGIQVFSQDPINNNTTICWDVSWSMADRDIAKDFSVLEKVFKKNANQEVQLLMFSINVEEKRFIIKNGDWSDLKRELENTSYDGGTIYEVLKDKVENPNVYVFTDGNKTLSKDILTLKAKSFLINSSPNRNTAYLERTALLNKSRLMDFATMLPHNIKKLQQQKTVKTKEVQKQMIRGTVYVDNKPTSNVKITVKGISDTSVTGAEGNFSIAAQVGDTLVVTSRDLRTVKVIPIEVMTHTSVFMDAYIFSLDEVVVVEKRQKEELIQTGYGIQDKKTLGYTVSTIGEEDVSAVQTNVAESINTKVSGLKLGKSTGHLKGTGLEKAEIRGRNTINMNPYALIVLNGVPLDRSSRSVNTRNGSMNSRQTDYSFIDPSNIANISVLKGLAATNAYGSEGTNGVILITTKAAVGAAITKEKKDLALVQNNVYDVNESQLVTEASSDFIGFSENSSVEKAYNYYLINRNVHLGSIQFHLAAFNFFKNRDLKLARSVISSILEHSNKNIEHLKVVSLALSAAGDYENVVRINEEIITRSPNDVNAYYAKALAKKELGKYLEAFNEMMALATNDTFFSVNASGIKKTINRDIKNLLFEHKNLINTSKVEAKYLNNIKYKVRLVFEWNQPGIEFELQFVNPQKRFFNWMHTNDEIKSRIKDEINDNYRIEEYEFNGDVAGEWVINAKYLGETIAKNETPFVLKCTIFNDFGYPNQSKENVITFFSKVDEKKNLKTLTVN